MSTESTAPGWLRRFVSWTARPTVVLVLGAVSVTTLAVLLVLRFAAPDAIAAAVAGAGVDPRPLPLGTGLLAVVGLGAAGAGADRRTRVGGVLGLFGMLGTAAWYLVALVAALLR